MYTLFIIDDHPLVSEGIATMIKNVEGLQICGSSKTGNEALEKLKELEPDIILLDISLPDIDGLELCTQIRKTNKTAKILGLTSANEAGLITQLLKRGANGFLLKNMEKEELLTAIECVKKGKTFLSNDANEKVLQQFHSLHDAVISTPVLTRREKEVLHWLNEGYSNSQIAEKLFLSHHTVDSHRKHLMQKLNTNNVQQLLKTAKDFKLI